MKRAFLFWWTHLCCYMRITSIASACFRKESLTTSTFLWKNHSEGLEIFTKQFKFLISCTFWSIFRATSKSKSVIIYHQKLDVEKSVKIQSNRSGGLNKPYGLYQDMPSITRMNHQWLMNIRWRGWFWMFAFWIVRWLNYFKKKSSNFT